MNRRAFLTALGLGSLLPSLKLPAVPPVAAAPAVTLPILETWKIPDARPFSEYVWVSLTQPQAGPVEAIVIHGNQQTRRPTMDLGNGLYKVDLTAEDTGPVIVMRENHVNFIETWR